MEKSQRQNRKRRHRRVMDMHDKAVELLEKIANSVHDRDSNSSLCFSNAEILLVKEWLENEARRARISGSTYTLKGNINEKRL